jgi:hypothetical protein
MMPGLALLLRLVVLLVLPTSAACAGSAASIPRTDAPITAEELDATAAANILAAVRDLRPQWLNRVEGAFLDGLPVSVRQLQQESLRGIAEIRLLSAGEATARYGTRSLSGSFLEVVRQW